MVALQKAQQCRPNTFAKDSFLAHEIRKFRDECPIKGP